LSKLARPVLGRSSSLRTAAHLIILTYWALRSALFWVITQRVDAA